MSFMNVYNEKSTAISNTSIGTLSSDKHLLMLQDSKEFVQQVKTHVIGLLKGPSLNLTKMTYGDDLHID